MRMHDGGKMSDEKIPTNSDLELDVIAAARLWIKAVRHGGESEMDAGSKLLLEAVDAIELRIRQPAPFQPPLLIPESRGL